MQKTKECREKGLRVKMSKPEEDIPPIFKTVYTRNIVYVILWQLVTSKTTPINWIIILHLLYSPPCLPT